MSILERLDFEYGDPYTRSDMTAKKLAEVDPENPILDIFDFFRNKEPIAIDRIEAINVLSDAMENAIRRAIEAENGGTLLVFKVDGKRDYYEY